MTTERLRDLPVEEVMARWPATAEVFNGHALACVGCALAPFCTVQDAATTYDLLPQEFVAELLAIIDAGR